MNQAEGLVLSKDRSPAEKIDFDKTLALLALKMLMFMPNKDITLLPHKIFQRFQSFWFQLKRIIFGTSLDVVLR